MNGQINERSYNNTNSTLTLNDSFPRTTGNTSSESMLAESPESVEEDNPKIWPAWAESVQCISHLLLALYSSVTFLIYYCKQKTSANRG